MNKKSSGIINTLKASKGAEWLEARRREYEGYDYKDGEIDSEIAADFFGAAVTQKEFERQIKTAELNKSFTQKIIDKVKEVVAELKEIMQKLRGQRLIYDAALDTDAETLDFFVDNLERILNQAGTETKNTATEDGVKYQLKVGAAADVEKALKDKNYRDDVYLTESSPAVIANQKGVRNLPMLMKASHIRENVFTEAEARQRGLKVDKNINYHGLGKNLFLKIIDGLDDVQYAYRGTKNADNPSRRENYFLLISQYKDGDGNTINIPVYINEKGSYNRVFIDTNKIATVYGKENFSDYIQKEVRKGNLVRIKNKSTQASERTTPIVAGYSLNASVDTTVTQKSPSVNSILSENPKKITTETKNTAENSGVKRQAKIGETDDGRGIYKTNYAKGTPKSVKQQDIIDLVQNVWSKKPISLYITENNSSRKITANFDPTLSERSDLAKIVYGNKKGTASEKRMTLDLSSDLYRIATESKNSGNLSEKGKLNPTHNGVTDWHYFVTNIVYEDDNGERTDCHMNIDVKEKPSGNFFYSFAIEKGTAPQTLLAVVADKESTTVPIISISDSSEKSNLKNRNSEKNISHPKKQVKLDVTEYSDDERKQHSADAKAYFGKTYNWKETGYILRNGDKLDFSGRHEGAPGGYRTVDHRDIADAMPDGYGGNDYSGAMVQFMSEGNI